MRHHRNKCTLRGVAGGLPELGGFAGWRDGMATDGSTWTPEMDVSEEEWEAIKEGDRARMQARAAPAGSGDAAAACGFTGSASCRGAAAPPA